MWGHCSVKSVGPSPPTLPKKSKNQNCVIFLLFVFYSFLSSVPLYNYLIAIFLQFNEKVYFTVLLPLSGTDTW